MTLKLATIWEGIALYVTANGEAFSLSTKRGLLLKPIHSNTLGHVNKKYHIRYYNKIVLNTFVNGIKTSKNFWLHILVCTAFHGPRPSSKHQVDHINRDRWDNRPENLRWVTCHENHMNSITHIRRLERLEREKRALLSAQPVQLVINF